MKLLYEDILLEKMTAQCFAHIVLELLKDTDKIGVARQIIIDRDGKYVKEKDDEYLNSFPIEDIKQDLVDFADNWIHEIKDIPEVLSVENHGSPYLGFSDYVDVRLKVPEDKHLQNFYKEHRGKYKNCSFRFTDHPIPKEQYRDKSGKIIRAQVDLKDKSFKEASEEMKQKILSYIDKVHKQEKKYIQDNFVTVTDIKKDAFESENEKVINAFTDQFNKYSKVKNWYKNNNILKKMCNNLDKQGIICQPDVIVSYITSLDNNEQDKEATK
ncbi:MAG: hypothetical protein J6V44_05960 [Methanobrevibacter sp.]|nr:hypothetical protein [Methanobrevibacter sp.]MBO7692796.1 hypothetical protein [Methanobrevibacter sp.]